MTIKTRLITMMAVAIVGFAAVFLTATIGLSQLSAHITEIGEQSIPHLETAEDIIAESLAFQRDMLRLVLVTDPARRERIQNRIIATRAHIAQLNEQLNSSLTNENAKQLLSEIMRLKQTPVNFNNQIMELIAKNQLEQAIEIATGLPYRDSYEAYMTKMKELIAFEKKSAQEEVIAGEADAMRAKLWILAISSIALIGLILFSLFVIRSVTQAVNQVVSAISNVAQTATFTTRIPARHDELNAISTHLNTLFDGLDKAIQEANRVVSAIAQADFTARVQGQYMGDLDKLKQGVNASAESVSFMMNELEKVMKGLNDGKFNTRMDNRVPQVFRNLVEQALSNIHTVIGDINTVMAQMNQGNFTARVQAQTSGDLQAMKLNINDAMTRLAEAVAGITHIVTAQSQGDLTQALQLEMKGQLQQLKNAINDSSRQLKNIVGSAVHAAMVVDDASTQVSSGASNLASRVQQQAAAIEQTSATMTEMTSAVQANTTNARKVADLTGQVQTQAGEGVSVMQETISAMQSIQESSNKIADIVTLIDGIAFQTNLLALNAAVEAARAGEHGRGFAVVAGEVRALAQKSADAAKDIKDLIGDSAHRVERGTHLAQKSGQVLNEIANSIQQVAGMVSAIANASHEQSIGIEQVHRSVADIDRVTQENAALVEETSAASESLEREANNLRQNMAFFRT